LVFELKTEFSMVFFILVWFTSYENMDTYL